MQRTPSSRPLLNELPNSNRTDLPQSMALWLVRSGSRGEYEQRFIADGRIYFQHRTIPGDLSGVTESELKKKNRQAWAFTFGMEIGDWVVMPSKLKRTIHLGEIKGAYMFTPDAGETLRHSRETEWFAVDIPRNAFEGDLLNSFGAFLTICQITRNDAENRVRRIGAREAQ